MTDDILTARVKLPDKYSFQRLHLVRTTDHHKWVSTDAPPHRLVFVFSRNKCGKLILTAESLSWPNFTTLRDSSALSHRAIPHRLLTDWCCLPYSHNQWSLLNTECVGVMLCVPWSHFLFISCWQKNIFVGMCIGVTLCVLHSYIGMGDNELMVTLLKVGYSLQPLR